METAIVSVAVATVWTKPESPREIDQPALVNPVDFRAWLNGLTIEQKLGFYDNRAIQTQALYGTRVEILEQQGDWSRVLIPEQPSSKDERGYPGWAPTRQLAPWTEAFAIRVGQELAQISADTARLYDEEYATGIELPYLTRLPLLATEEEWVKVATPTGQGFLRQEDVQVIRAHLPLTIEGNRGEAIVSAAKRFVNLPYLWGGMSSYGYDCSGYAYQMHRAVGLLIPRDAHDQAAAGKWVEKSDLLPGDLVFFSHNEGKGAVHHVGIYIGNGEMIHSPDSRSAVEIVKLAGYKLENEHVISRRYWE